MKILMLVFFIFSCIVFGNQKPYKNEKYKIVYEIDQSKKITGDKPISVVYVFDAWVSKANSQNKIDILLDVKNPDTDRVHKVEMKKNGKVWEAEIDIPSDAQLLSYYLTDGSEYDYNGNKTYISYIYEKNGQPVMGARFRNLDFMVIANEPLSKQIEEISAELKDYPRNWVAHFAFWNKKFQDREGSNFLHLDSLFMYSGQMPKYFDELEKRFGANDTLTKYRLYTESLVIWQLGMLKNTSEAIYNGLTDASYKRFDGANKTILPEWLKRSYAKLKEEPKNQTGKINIDSIQVMYKLKRKAFKEKYINNDAPDFEFVTINGDKHKLSDFKGKVVYLEFWGSWCGPCVAEIPYIKKAYDILKDKDVVFISISSDARAKKWTDNHLKEYCKEKQMDWIQVLDKTDNSIIDKYQITSFPTPFIIDKNGKVADIDSRGEELSEKIELILSNK